MPQGLFHRATNPDIWVTGVKPKRDPATTTNTERTKSGLALIMAGIILAPIPVAMYIGFILGIIGVIQLIFGREPFDQPHTNYIILSIIIWIVGSAISLAGAFSFRFDLASWVGQPAAVVTLAYDDLLISTLIGGAIVGISYVLLTYALQTSKGRLMLYVAYATSLGVGILVAFIISSQLPSAEAQLYSGGGGSALTALQAESQLLGLLGLIPSAIFVIAYYQAYRRIDRGEIP
jgi:hypothetical protein